MSEKRVIHLPDLPKDDYYEDFVAATLCAGGYYIEKRIDLREPTNILELDIVTSKYFNDHVEKTLSEVKSANWGFPDVFKVRGWLDYLKHTKASFVCLNTDKRDFEQMQVVAKSLGIDLLDIKIEGNNIERSSLYKAYDIKISNEDLTKTAISALRFAFRMEKLMVNSYLKPLTKDTSSLATYKETAEFIYTVCEHSFFQNNAYERIKEVFNAFIKYKNITARMDYEKNYGEYPETDSLKISDPSFRQLFYDCTAKKNPLHIALYAELMCRLTMLQLCVEESFREKELKGLSLTLERMGLPGNIHDGIVKMQRNHKYYYLYPHFWQIFIYVFGGFILEEKKDLEYQMLSELTNVPIEEVPKALDAFDILFPIPTASWLYHNSFSNISILNFMPIQFSGVGANFRRIMYRKNDNEATYEDMSSMFSKPYTIKDLIKYNDVAVEYLYMDKRIRFEE